MSKFTAISDALAVSGWSIRSLDLASDCWWAKEIWELRSRRSPKDKTLYVSLLINPMEEFDRNNPPDRAVWSVALTHDVPTSARDTQGEDVPINRRFEEAVSEIVKRAETMRLAD